MVESTLIDNMFMALADPTRRGILEQVARVELSIGDIASHYSLSFAAVSKHIKVLERAQLITKHRRGKEQIVSMVPETVALAEQQLERYAQLWSERFEQLDNILSEMEG